MNEGPATKLDIATSSVQKGHPITFVVILLGAIIMGSALAGPESTANGSTVVLALVSGVFLFLGGWLAARAHYFGHD